MKYNFDQIVDRSNSDCEKYGNTTAIFGTCDVLPLWIADMDFMSGDFIIDAIKRRAEHGVFGYTFRSECYHEAIQGWIERHSGWYVDSTWLSFSPGVVAGVTFAMLGTTNAGDGVLIQPPVYHPFAHAIRLNDRVVVNNPLKETETGYEIDFQDFEAKLQQVKAFILCNPHNPTGRVFTREELLRMAELCLKYNVKIISDEIHADFTFQPHQHIHIASLSKEIADITFTLIAPSKSFNIAGFCTAVAIIPNPELKQIYQQQVMKIHIDNSNIFGATALQAAYSQGDQWMEEVKQYLESNIDHCLEFIHEHIPSVKCRKPEATFLLWLDFREWGLTQQELNCFLVKEARLGMNDGTIFGIEGEGFQRMNIGAPRATIDLALYRLKKAAIRCGYQKESSK